MINKIIFGAAESSVFGQRGISDKRRPGIFFHHEDDRPRASGGFGVTVNKAQNLEDHVLVRYYKYFTPVVYFEDTAHHEKICDEVNANVFDFNTLREKIVNGAKQEGKKAVVLLFYNHTIIDPGFLALLIGGLRNKGIEPVLNLDDTKVLKETGVSSDFVTIKSDFSAACDVVIALNEKLADTTLNPPEIPKTLASILKPGSPRRKPEVIMFSFSPEGGKLMPSTVASGGEQFARDILECLNGERKVILDLSDVTYVDEVLRGQLALLTRKIKEQCGPKATLEVCNVHPQVYDAFKTAVLHRMFTITAKPSVKFDD